jgi:predicted DNA-binding transcriptional regulator AlpA
MKLNTHTDRTLKSTRRTPNTYTHADRLEAIGQLDDNTRVLMSFREACVLLDVSAPYGYTLARKGEFPGAMRISDAWKVNRIALFNYLHGIECSACNEKREAANI